MANHRPAHKSPSRRSAPPPRRGRTFTAILVGGILGAGGLAAVTMTGAADDGAGPTPSIATTTAPVTAAPATTQPPVSPSTTATSAPATTAAPVATTTTAPPAITIEVTVGIDDGPERFDQVALGTTVTLAVTNPDQDDEFHLHGYDLGNKIKVPAGETLRLTFVADRAGTFELESHDTHDTLMYLLVE